MKHLVVSLTIGILITVYPSYVLAQDNDNGSNPKLKRWDVSIYLAGTIGGPAKDMEKAMVAGGFDQTTGANFFGPGRAHPFSRRGPQYFGEYTYMIGIYYKLKPPFVVGAIASRADLGETRGYRSPSLYMAPRYSVSTIAPIVSVQVKGFRFGIGPALHFAKSCKDKAGEKVRKQSIKKFGFLIDFCIIIPEKSNFFVELKAQYRGVGRVEIGPFEASYFDNTATLPATNVSYNHWFVGLGVGIRL